MIIACKEAKTAAELAEHKWDSAQKKKKNTWYIFWYIVENTIKVRLKIGAVDHIFITFNFIGHDKSPLKLFLCDHILTSIFRWIHLKKPFLSSTNCSQITRTSSPTFLFKSLQKVNPTKSQKDYNKSNSAIWWQNISTTRASDGIINTIE